MFSLAFKISKIFVSTLKIEKYYNKCVGIMCLLATKNDKNYDFFAVINKNIKIK